MTVDESQISTASASSGTSKAKATIVNASSASVQTETCITESGQDVGKPCLFPFPICHPLCPAYTIDEARMQRNLTDEVMVPENLHQGKLVRLEAERRLAIRYFCYLNISQKNGYDNVNYFQETFG